MFGNQTDLPWLRLLRPGFRHCWAVVELPLGWLILDPLAGCLDVQFHPYSRLADLPGWYAGQGLPLVPICLPHGPQSPAPWAPLTCVELIKRLLGLHQRWVLTPWQLFCHLSRL